MDKVRPAVGRDTARVLRVAWAAAACLLLAIAAPPAIAQLGMGTAFTYQGSLVDGTTPANGSFDFQFLLHDDESASSQIGSTVFALATPVSKGVFTVSLDFGAGAFDGGERWLEILVQPAGGGGYVPLTPRVAIRPAPYSLFAADADTVDGLHASDLFERQGEAHVIPFTTPDPTTNAANLVAAYAAAKALTPTVRPSRRPIARSFSSRPETTTWAGERCSSTRNSWT